MRSETWYPTRLLYLDAPQEGGDRVRLIHTADEVPSGEYVTLGHCWGKARLIQLTRATLPKFQSAIAIANMLKTFQDAIISAKRLGVPYIWIDSLCIFQGKDDLTDWFHEVALMHKVYSHSFCNLSAFAAIDSSKGLFFRRDPEFLHAVEGVLCVDEFEEDNDFVNFRFIDYLFQQINVSHSYINKREWALQERLLSPRVLHFERYQLFWECREIDASESYPEDLPKILTYQVHTNFKALNPSAYIKK